MCEPLIYQHRCLSSQTESHSQRQHTQGVLRYRDVQQMEEGVLCHQHLVLFGTFRQMTVEPYPQAHRSPFSY